jgi:hypothetical protein
MGLGHDILGAYVLRDDGRAAGRNRADADLSSRALHRLV